MGVHRLVRHAVVASRARFSRWICAAGLALVAAVPVLAQEPDPLAALDPVSKFAVESMMDSAKTLGLPQRALFLLARQGIALKADNRKIVQAVRSQYDRLKLAYSVLGPVGDEELTAAAAVLQAGVKPAQLAAFKPRQKGRSDLEAFATWADLITRGVPNEEASTAITKLWQDGADDATFRSLQKDVQADISSGLNPGAALQNRIRETPARVTPKPAQPEG